MGRLPPFTGTAVKVTGVPAHTGLEEGVTPTLTGRMALTAIVTEFEVAGFPVGQGMLELRTQFTTSLFAGAYANTWVLVPDAIPFTYHW